MTPLHAISSVAVAIAAIQTALKRLTGPIHPCSFAPSLNRQIATTTTHGEGEGEVAFFSAKRWDRKSRTELIESATPCHDAQVVGPYRNSNPFRLTVLAALSEDYTTAPQHLQ